MGWAGPLAPTVTADSAPRAPSASTALAKAERRRRTLASISHPAASTTTTSYDTTAQRWVTRVSSGNNGKNVFAGGVAFAIPAGGLPGGINPVTWTAALTVDQPGVTFNWNWAAAVYTSFSTNYNAIGVKPVDGNAQNPYNNNDQAGSPENYKSSVTGGATGNGGTNYTCLLYTSPSPRDRTRSRMPSSA